MVKLVIVIIKFVLFTVTSTHTIDHQFINVIPISKQSTFNSFIVLGKIFRSITLMMYPVGVTIHCEKICNIIVHSCLNFS